MIFSDRLKKLDWILSGAVLLLAAFGILEILAISQGDAQMSINLVKQIIALAIGFILMVSISFFDYRFLKLNSYAAIIFYAGSIGLLFALLIIGSNIRGASAWIKIGGFSIEPVEFVKISLIILFAKYFSQRHIEMYRFFHTAVSGAYLALPVGLVLLQPDLGSAVVMCGVWFFALLISGISKKHLATILAIVALLFLFSWSVLFKEYQKDRIITFLNPYHDPQGAGYNVIQSMIAIGDGGFLGRGLGYGSQVQFGFLPEAHNDFIFASIAEEFGFIGILIILSLSSVIIWRIIKIAGSAENNFARLFCAGLASWIFIQIMINAGMNLGLMPVTGITFPFLSYGGSSLVALFVALGIAQSIRLRITN